MGTHVFNQEQWKAVMGEENHCAWTGDNLRERSNRMKEVGKPKDSSR